MISFRDSSSFFVFSVRTQNTDHRTLLYSLNLNLAFYLTFSLFFVQSYGDFSPLGSGEDGNSGEKVEEGGGGEVKAVVATAADNDKGWGDGWFQSRDSCVAAAVVGCKQDVCMGQLRDQLG